MAKSSIIRSFYIGFICLIFAGLIGFSIYQHRMYKEGIATDIRSTPAPTGEQLSDTPVAASVSADNP
jgi:hypothetical protein